MLLIIVILVVVVLSGVGYFFYFKNTNKKLKLSEEKQTANDFINVTNILGDKLYTNDGKVFKYIKLEPIYMDLMSKREKTNFTKKLTAEFSTEEKIFKLITLSRTVDVSPLIKQYEDLINNSTNKIIRRMQKNAILELGRMSRSSEVTERQFYICIFENHTDDGLQEVDKRSAELRRKFTDCGIKAKIIDETDIYRLCNLFANPYEFNLENAEYHVTIPTIDGVD